MAVTANWEQHGCASTRGTYNASASASFATISKTCFHASLTNGSSDFSVCGTVEKGNKCSGQPGLK